MPLILALLAQTAALPAHTADAAQSCGQALTIADAPAKSSMQLTSQFTYLAMQSANARPEGKFFDQLRKLSGEISKRPALSSEKATELAELCRKRFPLADATSPAKLPTDAFHRDLLCFGVLSVLQGAAEEVVTTGNTANLTKINAALALLTDKLNTATLQARGLNSDDLFVRALGEEMLASLTIGNPLTISAACGVPVS